MSLPRLRTLLLAALPFLVLYTISTTYPDLLATLPKLTPQALRTLDFGFLSDLPGSLLSSTKTASPHANDASAEKGESFTRHIVAVGDLHGDLPNARRVLQFAGVTDEFGDWAGGVDYFVQTGDIIDRGPDTIALFDWMDKLREQAPLKGGAVLSNLGNHEWMNAIGDWRYVYPSELATFKSVADRQAMLSTGRIGRSWASNYTTASRLPLHPSLGPPNTPYPSARSRYQKDADEHGGYSHHYDRENDPMSHAALSFVHGGLSPTYQDLTPFPARINEISNTLLAKVQGRTPQPPPHPPNKYPGLPEDTTPQEAALYDSNGPLWYRGWALDPEDKACKDVEGVLARTGTRRMIMGHTPDFKNIVTRCGGKIIIIDTGISHAYGGVLSALSIHYTLTPLSSEADRAKGTNKQRWLEKEVVSAIYLDRQQILVEDEREVDGNFSTWIN